MRKINVSMVEIKQFVKYVVVRVSVHIIKLDQYVRSAEVLPSVNMIEKSINVKKIAAVAAGAAMLVQEGVQLLGGARLGRHRQLQVRPVEAAQEEAGRCGEQPLHHVRAGRRVGGGG